MPGGRLTYEERQRVAAGLAVGHSCAEIARRLGRPGSTISREVTRNGGIRGYRANQAQQATKWRARRRKPHPSAPYATDVRDALGQRGFEDRFTEMMAQTGVPAMMAKVLVCLFTSDTGSGSAAELVARLRVSPASISKAVGWLEQRGLVSRERDGRRQRYSISEDAWYQAWLTSVQSMALWADVTRQGADVFGSATPAGARLHATSQFFHHLGHDMTQAAEHWRQTIATAPLNSFRSPVSAEAVRE
ncbi:GbsR/MarR family transcriptional regulator [Kibdelosporangium phytohabitans]|uniref:MarR family transcriptional regulator n=1 Tax=Kibdelosporangium phytohabitans TaxID=860235 RepID=A0A0N9HWS4_9PSEU|nr:MarR family transcriptional regulator [Kibdelosporangium phytohabitans]MBE1468757.1 DNA-binding transcriptional ArsR family regulator [Kibdelosporangium phytohabitans]